MLHTWKCTYTRGRNPPCSYGSSGRPEATLESLSCRVSACVDGGSSPAGMPPLRPVLSGLKAPLHVTCMESHMTSGLMEISCSCMPKSTWLTVLHWTDSHATTTLERKACQLTWRPSDCTPFPHRASCPAPRRPSGPCLVTRPPARSRTHAATASCSHSTCCSVEFVGEWHCHTCASQVTLQKAPEAPM